LKPLSFYFFIRGEINSTVEFLQLSFILLMVFHVPFQFGIGGDVLLDNLQITLLHGPGLLTGKM
jgi:hypothetical protein